MPADGEREVLAWFRAHAPRFGLVPTALYCRPVLSPGGFENRSFAVGDGQRRLHVKLGNRDGAAGLLQWAAVHAELEARYGAPPLICALGGGAIAGEAVALIFEHVPGRAPDPRADHGVLRRALALAVLLHRDAALGARLGGGPSRSCADELVDTYVRRLRADLEECGAALAGLPFLEPGFPAWAAAEVSALEAAARADPAFAAPAVATVHGDLYAANLIVERGRLWVLDWDDLHPRGDGVLDATNLLRPLLLAGRGSHLLRGYLDAAADPTAAARVPLYRRAMLLDEIIDSLADHVAADAVPEHAVAVRARQRHAHLRARAAYRREYGA